MATGDKLVNLDVLKNTVQKEVVDLKSAINLMQSPTFTDGKYINASGGLSDSSNWVTYEFIPVPGATKIHVSGLFGKLAAANSYNIWCYDKYKSPLGGVFVTETANTDNNTDVDLITGTEYISITTNKIKQYSGGVYVNTDECLNGIDAKIFANSGDNVARVAHTTKNGIFAYTFTNNVHTVSWNGEATDYFLVKYKNVQYKVGKSDSNPDYTFPDSDLTLSTSSAIAIVLRPSTGTVQLRGTSTIRYDDIKLAWLYGDRTIFFENDVLFLHSNNRDKWISVVNQKNDGLFENSTYLYAGKVEVDTTNKIVTLTNIAVLGAKNAVSVISGYSQVFDYSQLQNPTHAFAVFVNSSGAYIDNVKNIATAQYGHTEKDYLLFAFYNKSFIGTQKMYPGRWFIDGVDASTDLGIYKTTARIFKKVVCCGDSYTSGHIVDSDNVAHDTNQDFAWPHYMSLITGNTWVNCGKSGANVWTWLSNSRGLKKAIASGKSQAYMIGLGINDSSSGSNGIPIGTTADIGTENQTYYAGLSKIVRELHTISPDSKIFLQTLPRTGSGYEPYNEAITYIASLYHNDYNTHLIDLFAHIDLYNVASVSNDSIGGHFTGIGYEQFAEILFMLMSDYINTHVSEFQDVFSIEYDNEPTKEGIDGLIAANSSDAVSISASTANVEGTGSYVELDGNVYFSIFISFKQDIVSSALTPFNLPAPSTTGLLFYEHDLSMDELSQYLTYTDAWRVGGSHKAHTVAFVFGKYQKE